MNIRTMFSAAAGTERAGFDLLYHSAFLMHAWERVAGNVGVRTPGIDRATVVRNETRIGVGAFLTHLRDSLKSGEFRAGRGAAGHDGARTTGLRLAPEKTRVLHRRGLRPPQLPHPQTTEVRDEQA